MPVPQFDNNGLLPKGVFDCTFAEIEVSFCLNDHRQGLFDRLKRFLDVEWYPHNIAAPILIDGSFVRNKPLPDDIDIVFDMTGHSNDATVVAISLWLRREELKKNYNVDVWVRHPAIPNDLAAFFQYVGDKAAAELNLQPKYPKGILRVQP